jgi:RNA polymerase-binding transcription factor DksA
MATNKKAAKPAAKAAKSVKPLAKKVKKAANPVSKSQVAAKKIGSPKTEKPTKKAKKDVAKAEKSTDKTLKLLPVKKQPKVEDKNVTAKSEAKSKVVTPTLTKPVAKTLQPKAVKPEPVKEVKVPKTSVKTVVPYLPDYKTLEQRQETTKSKEQLVRYNDSDLNEFRELINKKLEAAKKELAYLQGLITRRDDMGGDESDNRYMTMEDGSMSMEREQLSQMASRQITYIDHLEKALIRIENKTYGICRVTGKLIDKARLKAVPHATLSLEAKLGLVKPSSDQ